MLIRAVKLICVLITLSLGSEFTPQRRMEELPEVKKEKADFRNKYLQEVIKILTHDTNSDLEGKYKKNVWAMDLTMLLLGAYTRAWDSRAQYYAKELQDDALKELKKGRIRREPDRKLLRGDTQDHSNSLDVLYSASVSYGHIASPHEVQSTNVEATRRPHYAFRLSQQAIRNAVFREHAERLLELKQEIAFLRSQIDLYCKNQSDDAIYLWNVKPSDFNPMGMPARPSVFCMPCEVNVLLLEVQFAIRQGLAFISQQNSALGHRMCLLYMGQLTQTKAMAQQIELILAQLMTDYSKLNNMEKEKER